MAKASRWPAGETVRDLCLELAPDLTFEEIAKKGGFSPASLFNLLAGRSPRPRRGTLNGLAKALKIPVARAEAAAINSHAAAAKKR